MGLAGPGENKADAAWNKEATKNSRSITLNADFRSDGRTHPCFYYCSSVSVLRYSAEMKMKLTESVWVLDCLVRFDPTPVHLSKKSGFVWGDVHV